MDDQHTGREPALPTDVAITGNEPMLGGGCYCCHRAYAPHTISYMNILHFKICRACYHDLKIMLDEMQYQDVVERLHFKDIHQLRHAVIDQVFIGQKTFSYQPGEPPNERF